MPDFIEKPLTKLQDLREGSITRFEREHEEAIVLIRIRDRVVALSATCPHAGAPLEEGAICHGRLVCPWHKATFDLESGALLEPPALEGLRRFPVEIRDDMIHVGHASEPIHRVRPGHADHAGAKVFAIVGAGAAGAAACATLREYGFDGRILLIDEETTRPYDRTALSKFVPSGEMKPDDVYPLLPQGFVSAHSIETVNRRVARLDDATRNIEFADGEVLRYDAALIATGSEPVLPKIEGLKHEHVGERIAFLRSLADARQLDALANHGKRVVVIGGSFIGLETASALRKRGLDVTVVMPNALPFEKMFGKTIAERLMRLHEEQGVRFRTESEVGSIAFERNALCVDLARGTGATEMLECDFAVIGTGVSPATAYLSGVRRNDDGGMDVDASMRVSDTLFAAGDIAAFPLRSGQRQRIEHWRVAQQQARIAAMNMAGFPVAPPIVPFFWTFQHEKRFDYVGHAKAGDWSDTQTLGSLERLEFVTLYIRGDRVIAALGCNKEAAMAFLAERMREPLSVSQIRGALE
ncbi:MAG TPA: FAD-dependent oxidoreductase [Pararobbsia sp.]|nr:FAD-dependent oxidoreductase [Pararobbsia sp.]